MIAPLPTSLSRETRYETLRGALLLFFQVRGGAAPDELADQVIFRIVQNEAAGEKIRHLSAYARAVAENVLNESRRDLLWSSLPLNDSLPIFATDPAPREVLFDCFERCKRQCLTAAERALIESYYRGQGGRGIASRKRLANRLGISSDALAWRAFRIRRKLAECFFRCQENK